MADELWRLDASDTAGQIRAGDITAADATESHLERMAAVNSSVNAVTVEMAEIALQVAWAADRALAESGAVGPLHGVPVTIKENVDQIGFSTNNGVPDFDDRVATSDSPVVANLRNAGAIIIGRTNTPEFSLRYHTKNPLRGETGNPWDASLTPGGSSGGAASSVALGIGAIAHGNDLGGSLRYPAYCCGVATVRPTLGRVPAYNPTGTEERPPAFQLMSVQGPIARSVGDVRLALEAMSVGDARDPWWVPVPLRGPAVEPPIRVAMSLQPGETAPDPLVRQAVERAGEILAEAGYAVEEVAPPSFEACRRLWAELCFTDSHILMGEDMRQHGSNEVNAVHDSYLQARPPLDQAGYMRALAGRTARLREWVAFLEQYPICLLPVSQWLPMKANQDVDMIDRMDELLSAQAPLGAINMLGLPAAVVPTDVRSTLPLGVQLVANRFREDLCLDAAQVIEDAVGQPVRELWD